MEAKKKLCKKGTSKTGFYQGCGKSDYLQWGLCQDCKRNFLLNTETGQELIVKASKKAGFYSAQETKRTETKQKKERKWELMSTAAKIQIARKVFQKWIRDRDKYLPCISCGTFYSEEWHGSHYKNANEYSELIFNEDNVNKSCLRCNKFLHGAKETYRPALVKKIGEERVLYLESVTANKVYRYTDEELKEIIENYKHF